MTTLQTPGAVPIFEDHLSTVVPLADIKAWYTYTPGLQGDPLYFQEGVFNRGSILDYNGDPVYFIPQKGPPLVSAYAEQITIEDNTKDFYSKQDMLFSQEDKLMRDWLYAIEHKAHPILEIDSTLYFVSAGFNIANITQEGFALGPYIDIQAASEANKYYGISDSKKSAWIQRSLIRGINIIVNAKLIEQSSNLIGPVGWNSTVGTNANGIGGLSYANYAAIPSAAAASALWNTANSPKTVVLSQTAQTVGSRTYSGTSSAAEPVAVQYQPAGSGTIHPSAVIGELYNSTVSRVQTFSVVSTRYTYYPTCTYKQLGFTKIKGHGHYTLLGAFIVDNTTPEAADYTDFCDTNPKKKKYSAFLLGNNAPIDLPDNSGPGCLSKDVTIDSQEFIFPEQTITIPASTFLLQDGSIDPIYPTFPGAFVYDLQLKKWGKMAQDHKLLLNFSPINTHAGDGPIPVDIFSVSAGCLLTTGKIALFDKYPADSVIKYGKIGYYRNGYTDCEGVSVQFRSQAAGSISLEGSLDGKLINPAISQIKSYGSVYEYNAGFGSSARWFNVCISGYYDIKNIDFHGWKKGKR